MFQLFVNFVPGGGFILWCETETERQAERVGYRLVRSDCVHSFKVN